MSHPDSRRDAAFTPRPEERVERSAKLFRRLLLLASVALLSWALAVAAAARGIEEGDDIDGIVGAACSYDRRSDAGRAHVSDPTYRIDPPSGGPHAVAPASGGVKAPDALPTDGELVHAMEHGAVVVWYSGRLDAGTDRALRRLAESDRAVIVVPRPSLAVPLAVTAWHRRMFCDVVDLDAAARFVRTFRGRGPERVGL